MRLAAARPGYLLPYHRCSHRPSRRGPDPTDPTRERCTTCGATFPRSQE